MNRREWFQLTPLAALRPGAAMQEAAAPATAFAGEWRSIYQELEREAERILGVAAREMSSRQSWEAVRAARRQELCDMLGLQPLPPRTALRARVTGTLDRSDFTVEKIAFESMPRFYATANLYLPKTRPGPVAAIVYVCGHGFSPHGAKAMYQRHGISFARNGYACLIVDPIQISEVYAVHRGVFCLELHDWYSRGYTPAGVEVWNAMRAIDYLETRSEIDAKRIGMTGRSGGAAMTWFTAAIDDRVRVAAPVMGNSTYLANLRANTQRRHCDCMFTINFHCHEMSHQGALIAPRPLLMAHGRKDDLFPVPGYTKFEELMTGLYASYGDAGRFRNIVVETGHQDSDFLREEVMAWMDRHLLGIPSRKLEMAYKDAPPESVAVLEGKPPADAINRRIHLLFRPAAAPAAPPNRAAWEKRRAELVKILKERVFGGFPAAAPPVVIKDKVVERQGRQETFRLQSEGDLFLRARIRVPAKPRAPQLPALLYIVPAGEDPPETEWFLREVDSADAAVRMVLYPRDWSDRTIKASDRKDLLRNAMHVGRTPASMRVWDALRGFAALAEHPNADPARVLMAGKGEDAAVAVYAAALEPRIAQVMMIAPVDSHWQGAPLLNILRHTDLPEAAGLIAPRRLHFFQRMPPAYAPTRRIFEIAGGTVWETVSLEAAIEGVADGSLLHGI